MVEQEELQALLNSRGWDYFVRQILQPTVVGIRKELLTGKADRLHGFLTLKDVCEQIYKAAGYEGDAVKRLFS